MTVRYYSSVAAETTLVSGIAPANTTMQVASVSGLPVTYPYTMAVDYEGAVEELVEVTNAAGTTLTITRAIDGTSAATHNSGARVRHVSSARDFADSRNHENASTGVHGLAGGTAVVGTDTTQTLSNKTLNMATGTLNRIDIFNTGSGGLGWQTTINGDASFPSTNLLVLKPNSGANEVAVINSEGAYTARNKAATDSSSALYKFRATKSDGTTDIFRVLSSGTVRTVLTNGAQGYEMIPENDTAGGTQRAFTITNASGAAARAFWRATGEMNITSISPAAVTLDVNAAASQTANVFQVRNNAGTNLLNVTAAGAVHALGTIDTDANLVVDGTSTLTGAVSAGGGITQTSTGILYRPMQVGQESFVFSSSAQVDVNVTFPIAFPSTPKVTCAISSTTTFPSGSSALIVRAFNVTTTGMTLRMQDAGGASRTLTIPADWHACV